MNYFYVLLSGVSPAYFRTCFNQAEKLGQIFGHGSSQIFGVQPEAEYSMYPCNSCFGVSGV